LQFISDGYIIYLSVEVTGIDLLARFFRYFNEDNIMRTTIDGMSNSVNPDVFLVGNADWFDTDRIMDCLLIIADELERVIPLTNWESENDFTYLSESTFTSFIDMFQKPLTMLENAQDKALTDMRDAKNTSNSLKASQALDRYKVANERIDRFSSVLPALIQQFAELTSSDYQKPQARAKAYNMLADKKMELMAEIDEILR